MLIGIPGKNMNYNSLENTLKILIMIVLAIFLIAYFQRKSKIYEYKLKMFLRLLLAITTYTQNKNTTNLLNAH